AGRIARTSFYPIPAVDAAVLFFNREENLPRPHLRALLKAAFWGKRKTLASALRKNPFWSDESVAVSWNEKLTAIQQAHERIFAKRADDISVEEFFVVYDALNRS
ncbi:MAG TPA: hypothetical protein PLY93_11380, partial [Turneriella sp.]|nr:hypothetical protein [Turneriella sp.]